MTATKRNEPSIDLSIIIVTYNSASEITDCLNSINKAAGDIRYEIIVVDNQSNDGTSDQLYERKDIRFIQNIINGGFGQANNIGAGAAKGSFLLFLNPDTAIKRGSLAQFVDTAKALPKLGLLAPKLISEDGALQRSIHRRYPNWWSHCIQYNFLLFTLIQRVSPGYDYTHFSTKDHEKPREILHAMGAAMLMPRQVFTKLGGFDESFFLYFEETDLCLRCHNAGYKLFYTPEITLLHKLGSSSGENQFGQASAHYQESAYRYFRKTKGGGYTYLLFCLTIVELWLNSILLVVYIWLGSSRLRLSGRGNMANTGLTFTRRAITWHTSNWRKV